MKDQVANPISQIGYIEPGHGVRGKQRSGFSLAFYRGVQHPPYH